MKLATKDCVAAIIEYVIQNPGHVYKQFVGEPGVVVLQLAAAIIIKLEIEVVSI